MGHYTILDFLFVSIPEEVLTVFFVYAVLGKRNVVKPLYAMLGGLLAAFAFGAAQIVCYPNYTLTIPFDIVFLALIVYFTLRLNYLEAIIGALLASIAVLVVQGTTASILMSVFGISFPEYGRSQALRLLFPLPEFAILAVADLVLYVKKPGVFNFNRKKADKLQKSKIRHAVLQLTFMLLIIILNSRIFLFNIELFKTYIDIGLMVLDFAVIIVFTALVLYSAVKMGETIQKEEETIRKIDGKEIIQNIDYISALLDKEEYGEAKNLLKSMKDDIDAGMVKVNSFEKARE